MAVDLRGLIGRSAMFELAGSVRVSGLVYAVDPESGNALVCTPLEERTPADGESIRVRPSVVFAHAIRSVVAEAQGASAGLSDMHLARRAGQSITVSAASAAARFIKLRALLDMHRIPYEAVEDGAHDAAEPTLELFGSLRIAPPYDAESCACENDLVLSRIQALLGGIDVEREGGEAGLQLEMETTAVESACT